MVLARDEAVWVPVKVAGKDEWPSQEARMALPVEGPLEAVPGLWPSGATEGMVCVCNLDDLDASLDMGATVAEVVPATVQTRVCAQCGMIDTDGWILDEDLPTCESCKTRRPGGRSSCRGCSAAPEACDLLSYTGCVKCRPEPVQKHRKGASEGLVALSQWRLPCCAGSSKRPIRST